MRLTAAVVLLALVSGLTGTPNRSDKTDKSKGANKGGRKESAVKVEVFVPRAAISLGDINDGKTGIKLRFKNLGKKAAILWPMVKLRLRDAKGKEVAPNFRLGRFGLRQHDCFLEEIPFWTLKPGGTKEVDVKLTPYLDDPQLMIGWQLVAGKYQLVFTYEFDRKAYKAMCNSGCKNHDNPERPWNKAVEMKRTLKAVLRVKE